VAVLLRLVLTDSILKCFRFALAFGCVLFGLGGRVDAVRDHFLMITALIRRTEHVPISHLEREAIACLICWPLHIVFKNVLFGAHFYLLRFDVGFMSSAAISRQFVVDGVELTAF